MATSEDVAAARAEIEAKLQGLTRAQLDELATRRGLNPSDYANKSEIVEAILNSGLDTQEEYDSEVTTTTSPGVIPSPDQMITDPETAQQERFAGTTSDAATRAEGTSVQDVPPDPNDDPNKPSDDPNYDFPPAGDVDIATVEVIEAEGELIKKPSIEDMVILDGDHEAVPDPLDGRRAYILDVHPQDAFDTRDLLKEGFTVDDISLTVRTRDDYSATLFIPWAAVKKVEVRAVSPVRT